jgi:hypothetical protein
MVSVPTAGYAGGNTTTQTGQGIMANLETSGSFAIVQNLTYHYDETIAGTYYSNQWDGNAPTVSCSGPGCGTAPTAPTAPAVDPNAVIGIPGHPGIVNSNTCKCTFLDGGTLPSTTYTETAKLSTGSGRTGATYTYTYIYDVNPDTAVATTEDTNANTSDGIQVPALDPTATVDPNEPWVFFSSSGDATANINIDAMIAGESVVKNKTNGTKFSFSLFDSTDLDRVQNLTVTVTDSSNVVASASPGNTIVQNAPGALAGDPGAVDFAYATNAGSNGATSLLQNGDARSILNGVFPSPDVFTGNDNGGADGSALAYAQMDTVPVSLPAGDYTITLTGTVKGNSTSADIPFSVTNHVNIITPGCGG